MYFPQKRSKKSEIRYEFYKKCTQNTSKTPSTHNFNNNTCFPFTQQNMIASPHSNRHCLSPKTASHYCYYLVYTSLLAWAYDLINEVNQSHALIFKISFEIESKKTFKMLVMISMSKYE